LIKQGEYLSRAGDCIACHTAKDGKPFAGGLGIESPLGAIYSTNITPDKDTGIGNYTLEDFDRAVRHGVAKDGHS
ncbi:cytochrome c, partial [Achromobacter dolens]